MTRLLHRMEQKHKRTVAHMSKQVIPQTSADKTERILLSGHFYRRSRFFAVFIICIALLVAGFAVTGVWMSRGGDADLKDLGSPFETEEETGGNHFENPEETKKNEQNEGVTLPPAEPLPAGAVPIVNRDLSCSALGESYFHNETSLSPDLSTIFETDVSAQPTQAPLVLILHTHTSEGYLKREANYLMGDLGDVTYSKDDSQNVLAVGRALCETLNQKGITAIHCTVMHDDPTLAGSYARALESIRFYLTHYPSIRYVIDLHRDSVLNSDGEYIRAVVDGDGGSIAQIMPVVGSNGGGESNERWEGNFALALQLRTKLNATVPSLCRPVTLRNETYNQELAPYSLLLEIGTGACTVEEAVRAARLVGEALVNILLA